jgi:hypothetical protein
MANRLLKMSDRDFKATLDRLEKTQGDYLRELSHALQKLEPLYKDGLEQMPAATSRAVGPGEIHDLPKGAHLISYLQSASLQGV